MIQILHYDSHRLGNFQPCRGSFTLPKIFHHRFSSAIELSLSKGHRIQAPVGSSSSFHYFQPNSGLFHWNLHQFNAPLEIFTSTLRYDDKRINEKLFVHRAGSPLSRYQERGAFSLLPFSFSSEFPSTWFLSSIDNSC